jgi:ribonuclease J
MINQNNPGRNNSQKPNQSGTRVYRKDESSTSNTNNTKRRVTITPPSRIHSGIQNKKPEKNTTPKTPQNPNQGVNRRNQNTKKPLGASYQFSKFGRSKNANVPRSFSQPSLIEKFTSKNRLTIPPPKDGDIRIIPLGGVEEIGKNMTIVEIGEDIIIIDAGMQFKTEETPGVDYIIPNTSYLEERKDRIRGIVITHGHLDHIGGLSLVASRVGNPPIYSRHLTNLLIEKRHTDFPALPKLNFVDVEKNEVITLGKIRVRTFGVTHTIPDSMGVIIETPYGLIVNPGDYKLGQDVHGTPAESEEEEYAIFEKEKVLLLFADSTNIEKEGFSIPEKYAHDGLEKIIRSIKGRLIISAFGSHITRLMHIIKVAEELNKKVALEGRSIRTNLDVAIQAGVLEVKKDTIISTENIQDYPKDRIIILSTGAQGEEFSALMRASNKTHKSFKLEPGDTIVLSASIIPGNEISVQRLKDNIARQGVKIINYNTNETTIHATGHGNKEDIRWLHKKLNEKFFIPVHGWHSFLRQHADLAMECGIPKENIIVPDNGNIIEIIEGGTKIVVRKEKAPSANMIVDGHSVGDMQDVVIRDRQMLSSDGMFVLIASVNSKTRKLVKSPDIISRGFVYLKENQDLLRDVRILIKKTIENTNTPLTDSGIESIKESLGEQISRILFQKTAKRPLVIPVIIAL